MRVTFEGPHSHIKNAPAELAAACNGLVSSETVAEGSKANLAGESTSFVTLILHYSADLVVGLLASYIYDVATRTKVVVKLYGKNAKHLSKSDIRSLLDKKMSSPSDEEEN